MKKNQFLLIVILLLFTLLIGCEGELSGEQLGEEEEMVQNSEIENDVEEVVENKTPEPYEKAISSIIRKDYDIADTYLDLVISDFPESEYVFSAYILKGSMQISEFLSVGELINIYASAIKNPSVFLEREDSLLIEDQFGYIGDTYYQSIDEIEDTFIKITENFPGTKDHSEHYTDLSSVTFESSYRNDLSFFEDIGYPVPTDSEIEKYMNERYDTYIVELMLELSDEEAQFNNNYLPMFFFGAVALFEHNKTITEEIYQIIIELTEDDPYNEHRIQIEELMNRPDESNESNDDEMEYSLDNDYVSAENENNQKDGYNEDNIAFEWADGVKEEFEGEMVRRGYVNSKEDIVYRNGYIGGDGQGYYEAWSIAEDEDWYIVTVNVKTGWFSG